MLMLPSKLPANEKCVNTGKSGKALHHSSRRLRVLLIFAFSFVFVGAVSGQTVLQVPQAFPSIQSAVDAASAGDTVVVSPGHYLENIDFHGKAIILKSTAHNPDEAALTVIEGKLPGPVVTFHTGEPSAAVLDGFTITGGFPASATQGLGGGVYIAGASPTIRHNAITRNIGCAVMVLNGSSATLDSNDIHDTLSMIAGTKANIGACRDSSFGGTGPGTALFISGGQDVRVVGNFIHDNSKLPIENSTSLSPGAGLFLINTTGLRLERNIFARNSADASADLAMQDTPLSGTLQLINNLFYDDASYGASTRVGVLLQGSQQGSTFRVLATNNTFYGGTTELQLRFGPSVLRNNIFYATDAISSNPQPIGSGLFCASQGYLLDVSYSDIFNEGALADGGCPRGVSFLTINPPFRDATTRNLRLLSSSPLVDAGDIHAEGLPATDLDGKNRTVCGKVDIGAYQTHPNPPMVLTVAPNSVAGGSPVVFTATLTGNCNVPTGTVTFLDNGTAVGTGTLNGAAVAVLSTSFLTVGQHTITATYPGDFNFEDGTSNTVTLTVTGLPSATALSVQPNPAKAFQPITLTATVTDPYVAVTGNVTFTAGATVLGTAPLVNGVAAITSSQLGAGSYAVTATFNATTQFATSSATVQLVVEGAATTTTLRSALNPARFGQRVLFQALVAINRGGSVAQGTVTFRDGATVLGTMVLDSYSEASIATDTLSIGTHTITATFNGSKDADPSTSIPLIEVILPVTVTLQLTATPNPAHAGETVNLRLAASANDGHVVNGSADFAEGTNRLGTATFSNGVAVLAVNTLAVGTHTVVATYADPANGIGLALATVQVEVTPFDFAISSSGTKLDIPYSGYAETTVTLTPLGAYDRPVHLSCVNLPQNAQCGFEREWTEPLSKGPQTVKMIVNANLLLRYGPRGSVARLELWKMGAGVLAAGLVCFGLRRRRLAALCAIAFSVLLTTQGCGGKEPASTPVGDYTITATAQDATGQAHAVTLQMHVH